jgi:PilZ domain-containing protein
MAVSKVFGPGPTQSVKITREPGSERRQATRIITPPLAVSGQWNGVVDISEGGICLLTHKPLEAGERCFLILTDGWVFWTLELEAEVVWCRSDRVGLRWVNVLPEQEEWMQERFSAWQGTMNALLRRLPSE